LERQVYVAFDFNSMHFDERGSSRLRAFAWVRNYGAREDAKARRKVTRRWMWKKSLPSWWIRLSTLIGISGRDCF